MRGGETGWEYSAFRPCRGIRSNTGYKYPENTPAAENHRPSSSEHQRRISSTRWPLISWQPKLEVNLLFLI